jgi:ParB family chromosome partitioning protein
VNVEESVEKLFPFASKAKRSKVRSFALIFEELGDLLTFPERLTERQGLSVASALRAGADQELRETLALKAAGSAPEEWEQITEVLSKFEDKPKDRAKGGRPKTKPAAVYSKGIETGRGVKISWEPMKAGGYNLKLSGHIGNDEFDSIIEMMRERLS